MDSEERIDQLTKEIEIIRKEIQLKKGITNRNLGVIGLVIIICLIWMFVADRSAKAELVNEILIAREIILVDAENKTRMVLDAKENPSFSILDKEGEIRMYLELSSLGLPSISFADAQGKGRLYISLSYHDKPEIKMRDEKGVFFWVVP